MVMLPRMAGREGDEKRGGDGRRRVGAVLWWLGWSEWKKLISIHGEAEPTARSEEE